MLDETYPYGMRKVVTDTVLQELGATVDGRISTSESVLLQHGSDMSYHTPALPDAVVFPNTSEEVAEIVRLCQKHKLPMIPFGTGSSLEGHLMASRGGISIDLSEMNHILEINVDDLDATVEAGVTRVQLNDSLQPKGLFFPVDPGADATLGGMAATRASGTTTVRYGSMRNNVLSLKVVLPDGRIIRTSSRARKSSAGYDLTALYLGSEGTLGIITELTLRIYGTPEAISSAVCAFPTMHAAVRCVIQAIQMGIPVARMELLDDVQVDAVNRFASLNHERSPTLFFEFHGSEMGVVEQAETVAAIAAELGGGDFQWATTAEDRAKLWKARHEAYFAALDLRPGSKGFVTDVCVPISRLADCIEETQEDLSSTRLIAPILGHAGDGNFHLSILVDPSDPSELEEARSVNDRLVKRALAMGGTCTGEHGVGLGKIKYLEQEHGAAALDVMRSIKKAIDPDDLMNPGKILPPAGLSG